MPVGLTNPGQLQAIDGIRLAAMPCGIKSGKNSKDLVLIEIAETAKLAAVFTTNKFCAAPVVVAKEHLDRKKQARYLLINSGNANAGTGDSGYAAAVQCCRAIAQHGGTQVESVLPFSTGVIAVDLPVDKIIRAIPSLFGQLQQHGWLDAAEGIMTTDTLQKRLASR